MKTRLSLLVVLSLLLVSSMIGPGQAQGPAPQGIAGTAFTYQGQLKQNGLPVSGSCDFRFSLWDAETDGSQVGTTLDASAAPVSRGLFTVLLDFGPYAFNGDARYLGIEVRCPAGTGDFTPLAPRQALSPTPYAIFAGSAPWAGILNRPAGLDDGDDDTLAKLMCAPGEVAKWNGTAWACAADEDTQPVYTAGAGLSLTGNQFSVAFAGTGTATTAARSDHDHDAAYVNEGQPNSITSAMIWDGAVTVWDLRDGAVTAIKIADGATLAEILDDDGSGSGLDADLLDGHDSIYFQRRIEGTCPAGSSIREVNADGTVVCETDDNTTYSAGNQLSLVGTTFNVLEGSGSGLDADLLDGLDSSAFAPVIHTHNAANIISGMLSTDRFSAYADLTAEGYLGDAAGDLAQNNGTLQPTLNADLVDGQHGAFYQQRVSGTCPGGSSIREVNADGTVVCETDDDTTYTAGTGLTLVSNQFSLNTTYTDGRYWLLGGNSVSAEGNLGTTNNYALNVLVNNQRALRLVPHATSPSVIGGYSGNSVAAGIYGATIGGGGRSGSVNQVSGNFGTVGGGRGNTASDSATVGGGFGNTASSDSATVGGGFGNTASDTYATVGGGFGNTASSESATVGGGWFNIASNDSATVGGGFANTASGDSATVGGGRGNTTSGDSATVGGGYQNTAAGDYSFVVGRRAKNTDAAHDGVFLFADSNNVDFPSTAANQFRVRSTGGAEFVLGIDGSGNPTWKCSVSNGGSWACSSDRNLKENLTPADGRAILKALSRLPLYTWNAKGSNPSVKHLGPMAQDFYAIFGLGDNDTSIATIDLDGVALAAIQGLYQENLALKAQNKAQQEQIDDLQARLAALEALVAQLAQK